MGKLQAPTWSEQVVSLCGGVSPWRAADLLLIWGSGWLRCDELWRVIGLDVSLMSLPGRDAGIGVEERDEFDGERAALRRGLRDVSRWALNAR